MIAELNAVSARLSADEMIEQMIEQKILVQHANNLGINVSEKEIVEYAEQTKEAAEQNESPELKEIQEALAKKYHVSPEEYFFHPDVLKEYKKLLKINKLFHEMTDENIQKFIQTIKQQYKDTYKIDVTELNKL